MMTELEPTKSLKEAVLEIMNRGNVVYEWPDDEAAAYRDAGGFQDGRDAADAIRVRKLVDLIRHGVGVVAYAELRSAQAEAERYRSWYEEAERRADNLEAARDRDVATCIRQRDEALERALAAEAVVERVRGVLTKHGVQGGLQAAILEAKRILAMEPSDALRQDREIAWDMGHSNGWEDVNRNVRDGTDIQTPNPHRKAT